MNDNSREKFSDRAVHLVIVVLIACGSFPVFIAAMLRPSDGIFSLFFELSALSFLLSILFALVLVLMNHLHRRFAITAMFIILLANFLSGTALPAIS